MTQSRLKELFNYNEDTGVFTRRVSNNSNIKVGTIAGSVEKKGYVVIWFDGKSYKAHRLAWLYVFGKMPLDQIDHINHNKEDNRISNLREVTQSGNQQNRSQRKDNMSGVVGVHWSEQKRRWVAQINIDEKQTYLGSFSEFSEAVNARKLAEVAYGYHENHGKDKRWH